MKSSTRQYFQFAHHHILLLTLVYFSGRVLDAHAVPKQRPFNNTIPAILVFGDSTVDPGNNDYINRVFKGNFPPYGRDFANHAATGRFTNGRLPSDYIILYMGIKDYIPPYLNQSLSIEELITGVSFASAGTGYDPLTPTLSKQLEYFQEYRERLEGAIGKEETGDLIKRSIFLLSAGTNDFALNYFTEQLRRLSFSASNYEKFVLQHFKGFIQGLLSQGATKIAVVGLPPMGCLPVIITSNTIPLTGRQCVERINSVARDYNTLLQSEMRHLQSTQLNKETKIYYADIYGPLQDMIQNHQRYGFEVVSRACCGTGLVEASFMCNAKTPVCPDASKYIFWDAIHPTDRAYYLIFQAFRPLIDFIIKDSTS
ncbi:GDSL esterase/lipase At5g45960-like isoform X2 [Punica granatum]|uniref:GDSL esterase/lipase At5g45960-like isoform X2 n=1 Tax=Punica granatum TaxID=22663 RepID=A0A6P8DS31_PUNGR|nr:GDSL esterase/lipase At5g45960-like isoform X2 [Punica granatum]